MERESMDFDVVIVGAGPSGLAAACKIRQLSIETGNDVSVVVVEKGSEVGAHILSGAVIEPRALNELFPDWKNKGAPLNTAVDHDEFHYLLSDKRSVKLPHFLIPKPTQNDGNYIVSLGNVCRWLAEQAEELGADIFPGFPASSILYNDDGSVGGVITQDMGIAEDGSEKDGYMPGMELRAKYTLFSEGCRGHLGKQLIKQFNLDEGKDPQHYGIGIKELWEIKPENHRPGLVMHGLGWPLSQSNSTGGWFAYHIENNQVAIGLITDLAYSNPHVSPFDEMQRLKLHPKINQFLTGGTRVSYGARAITKGSFNSLPKMTFPGGMLIGCDAGTLNAVKIKGTHTAMKSGMLAAETVHAAVTQEERAHDELVEFDKTFKESWLYQELYQDRNFAGAQHKLGVYLGSGLLWAQYNLLGGKFPFTLHDKTPDYATLKPAASSKQINYPKPDGTITFDRLSSVFLSNTNHEENQRVHLQLADAAIPLTNNLPMYDEPAQRYCPAGVYEIIEDTDGKRFQINSQNCVHCKTCDIKDPAQNITWVTPEGGGGPNYPNM